MNGKTVKLIRKSLKTASPLKGANLRRATQLAKMDYKKLPRNKRFQAKQEMREVFNEEKDTTNA